MTTQITIENERDFIEQLMSNDNINPPRDLLMHVNAMNLGLFGSKRDRKIVNEFSKAQKDIVSSSLGRFMYHRGFNWFMLGVYFGIVTSHCSKED